MDGTANLHWEDKVKLDKILDELEFVENENIQKYNCVSCAKLALYHYISECKHVYCGKCHEKVHQRKCFVDGCQQTISQIIQDISFEKEVLQLKVYCANKKNGCDVEISLLDYWKHHQACSLATEKLIPKLYKEDKIMELTLESQELRKTIEDLRLKVIYLEKQHSDFESNQYRTITDIKTTHDMFKTTVGLRMSKIEKNSTGIGEKLDKHIQGTDELTTKVLQLEELFLSFKNELIQKNSDFQAESLSFKDVVALQMEKRALDKEEMQEKLKNINENLQTKTRLLEEQLDAFKSELDQFNRNIQIEQASFKEIVAAQFQKIELKNKNAMTTKTVDDGNVGRWRMIKQNMENIVNEEAQRMTNDTEDLDESLACTPETFMESESTEFTWKIEGITDFISTWKCGSDENAIFSDAFVMKDVGRSIKAKMYPVHKRYLCVTFVYDTKNSSTHQIYKHGFCILDQSDNAIKRDLWRMTIPIFNKETEMESVDGFHKTRLSFPIDLLKDRYSCYVKNDSVLVKIIAEPIQISYNSYFSNTGKLLWKIDNFQQKSSDYSEGLNTNIFSKYFYSSESGYRMVCSVRFLYSNLIFDLLFVKGQHDNGLDINFPHTTTLSILDQTGSTGQHLTKTCESNVASYEEILEVEYAEIDNGIYLNEDCLIIEVNVVAR